MILFFSINVVPGGDKRKRFPVVGHISLRARNVLRNALSNVGT